MAETWKCQCGKKLDGDKERCPMPGGVRCPLLPDKIPKK